MCPDFKFLGITLYYWGYILAFASDYLFNLLYYGKKYGFGKLQTFLTTTLAIPFGYGLIIITNLIHKSGLNWVRAVIYVPLAVYIICLILKTNFVKTIDMLAPMIAINHGVSHIFCIFQGCCYGYPYENGIWNEEQGEYLFPIQLVEAASILLIALGIIIYSKKKNFNTQGYPYAIHLLLYGFTRFIYEFFRDNTDQKWQISGLQWYALAAFVLGLIGVILIRVIKNKPDFLKKHAILFDTSLNEVDRIKKLIKH